MLTFLKVFKWNIQSLYARFWYDANLLRVQLIVQFQKVVKFFLKLATFMGTFHYYVFTKNNPIFLEFSILNCSEHFKVADY